MPPLPWAVVGSFDTKVYEEEKGKLYIKRFGSSPWNHFKPLEALTEEETEQLLEVEDHRKILKQLKENTGTHDVTHLYERVTIRLGDYDIDEDYANEEDGWYTHGEKLKPLLYLGYALKENLTGDAAIDITRRVKVYQVWRKDFAKDFIPVSAIGCVEAYLIISAQEEFGKYRPPNSGIFTIEAYDLRLELCRGNVILAWKGECGNAYTPKQWKKVVLPKIVEAYSEYQNQV